jgi:ubiquinone/menaquinone biosynthesis C-methylase UbiE
MSNRQYLEYWGRNFPWSFKGEKTSYEVRRKLRYELQDYMHEAIGFENYRHKIVLEIGCGGGIDSAEFAKNGAEVVSLDFTNEGTRSTRDTLREAGGIPNVIRASAEKLPFRPSSFDCVYSFGVLHHIPRIEIVIDEIASTLKANGDLLCMIYNRESLLYAYSILFLHRYEEASENELLSRYSERNFGCPFTRAYTKQEACQLINKNFDNVEAKVYFDVIDTLTMRKMKIDVPARSDLGWHIILNGKRKKQLTSSRPKAKAHE